MAKIQNGNNLNLKFSEKLVKVLLIYVLTD